MHHSVESHRSLGNGLEDEDEVDEDALARLADSFHSEGGRGSARKKVSWSKERATRGGSLGRSRGPLMSPINRAPPPLAALSNGHAEDDQDLTSRGRPVTRDIPLDESQTEWAVESTAQRRSSRASRKGAGMVFLGVWALFGVGTLVGSKRGLPTDTGIRVGRVIQREGAAILPDIPTPIVSKPIDNLPSIPTTKPSPHAPLSYDDLQFSHDPYTRAEDPERDHDDGPTTDYIIGRISAWICTTLYLTSRLPQIWKNYVRKSVEVSSFMLVVLDVSNILCLHRVCPSRFSYSLFWETRYMSHRSYLRLSLASRNLKQQRSSKRVYRAYYVTYL